MRLEAVPLVLYQGHRRARGLLTARQTADGHVDAGLAGAGVAAVANSDAKLGVVGGLPIGEKTSCSGVELAEDRWYCLEAHVERDLPNLLRFSVWLDGAEIVADTRYEPVNADWDTGGLYFKFGRSSYGGNNEFAVWHDDVALGTQRIGCGQ